MLKNNVEHQGHLKVNVTTFGLDLSNNVCEYEVNGLTNEKVIRGKRILMLIDAARMPWFHQSISQTFSLKNPANERIISHFIVLASAWKKL